MNKVEKFNLIVFGVFMLVTIGLTVYNSITFGTECVFCVR
jgi:hypothetical protein